MLEINGTYNSEEIFTAVHFKLEITISSFCCYAYVNYHLKCAKKESLVT